MEGLVTDMGALLAYATEQHELHYRCSEQLEQRDRLIQGMFSVQPARSRDVPDSECVICCDAPKVATLVHGDSGHFCCCLACARRLDCCPICRQPISMVIRQFV